MYWTYIVVAQRPERKAKHPNFRKDSFKIRPVQITQQPPVRFYVAGFYFFLWGRLYFLNHMTSPRWSGSSHLQLCTQILSKSLKATFKKPSAFQKGPVWGSTF